VEFMGLEAEGRLPERLPGSLPRSILFIADDTDPTGLDPRP
jgi:hypothetical protein